MAKKTMSPTAMAVASSHALDPAARRRSRPRGAGGPGAPRRRLHRPSPSPVLAGALAPPGGLGRVVDQLAADITDSVRRNIAGFVSAALAQADRSLPAAPKAVIGKSFGSFALPHFIDRDVRAVWLTPILTDPGIVDAARSASGRHLVVGGTADPSWRPDTIRRPRSRDARVWRESALAQLDLLTEVVSHLHAIR